MNRLLAALFAVAYLLTIVGANWAISRYGVIPVGLGQVAPAGVLFAGLAFTLRDLLHKVGGWSVVLAAIAGGIVLSFAIATPALALASAVAFGTSELADTAVYEPLRRRRWLFAVVLSNVVGTLVDSLIFLSLAFGSLQYLGGQWLGKFWMTAPFVVALGVHRFQQARRAVA